jgi:hypothetical protein
MKKILLSLTVTVTVVFCSCTNMNKPLTDEDKDKIISEAKVSISTLIQTCETPDPDKLKSTYLNSPDFVSLVGGVYSDYDESIINMYAFLNSVKSQKATIKNEKYVVLDATTVLYTANSKWETTLKNDSTIYMEPVGMQFLLKKIDNDWKVLSWTEEVIMK